MLWLWWGEEGEMNAGEKRKMKMQGERVKTIERDNIYLPLEVGYILQNTYVVGCRGNKIKMMVW